MGCAICDAAVREALRQGREPEPQDGVFEPQVPKRGPVFEGVCNVCDSRGRARALAGVLVRSECFVRANSPVLIISAPDYERRIYSHFFENITHVSRHGDHDDPTCIVGVDMLDLSRFDDRAFLYIFASYIIDYIERPWAALKEMRRVMRRGGTAFFTISPKRLGDFDEPIRLRSRNALRNTPYAPKLEDGTTGIPDCVFDRRALSGWFEEAGFALTILSVKDQISDLRFDVYAARAA